MEKLRNWLGEHKWLVLSGMAGLALFAYLFMRRSSSLSQGSIAATPTVPAGSAAPGAGALNLSSGTTTDLPANLVPPNCGPGMVPVPNIVSQGAGQPSFIVGWTCQPTNSAPAPPPTSGGCPMPDCPAGFHLWTPPGMMWASIFGGPSPPRPCPICVPDVPTPPAPITSAPPPAPTPIPTPPPPPAKTVTVCPWPNWCGSLWGIAQHLTGNGNNWQALYNANQGAIGNNPNLIHAGTVLTLPNGW